MVWRSRCQSFSKMICHCLRTSSPTFSQGPDLLSTLYILAFLERFTVLVDFWAGWTTADGLWSVKTSAFVLSSLHVILLFCWPAQRWFLLCFILFIWPMDLTGCQKVALHFACIECCWIIMDLCMILLWFWWRRQQSASKPYDSHSKSARFSSREN